MAAPTVYEVGRAPGAVILGDFNGDGTFQSARSFLTGTNAGSAAVSDFNGDGKPDLVVANEGNFACCGNEYTNGGMSVLLGKGDGSFQPPISFVAGQRPFSATVADFDPDGRPDLAVGLDYSVTLFY